MSEGKKFDQGKLRVDLIPPSFIEELAKVFTYGAEKYGDRNWEKGIRAHRLYGAAMRHLLKFWGGVTYDDESRLHHLSHAAWNILALQWMVRRYRDLDNRASSFEFTAGTLTTKRLEDEK